MRANIITQREGEKERKSVLSVRIRVIRTTIYLVINDNGIRHAESTGLHISPIKVQNAEVMRLAEVLRSKREVQLVGELNGVLKSPESRKTLYDYTESYSTMRGHEKQMYKILPYLEKFDGRKILIGEVTSRWFENFQTNMEKDSGLGPASQEKYCSVLRQVLKKAVRDNILTRDPSEGIRHIKVPETPRTYLTFDEVKKLIETEYIQPQAEPELQSDIRRGFLFSCCTGLRVSDIRQIKWSNIDRDAGRIVKQQQKTKNLVWIPLKKEAWNLINDGRDHTPDENLFPYLAESRTDTNRYIAQWAKTAGIQKHVTWHTARHTDATLLIEYGADLYTVQHLLGHSNISTTSRYAHLSDKKQRDAVDALPDFGIGE
jgi:site-specific recombinase XerD